MDKVDTEPTQGKVQISEDNENKFLTEDDIKFKYRIASVNDMVKTDDGEVKVVIK